MAIAGGHAAAIAASLDHMSSLSRITLAKLSWETGWERLSCWLRSFSVLATSRAATLCKVPATRLRTRSFFLSASFN
eukprot:2287621-Pyramimonas_sp.AAC.1